MKIQTNNKTTSHKNLFSKEGVLCFYLSEILNSRSFPEINFSTKTPLLLIAPILYPLPIIPA
jgi:hypothetical protein